MNVREVGNERIEFNDMVVQSRRVSHQDVNALGYRLECEGKCIVYSGDTDYCEDIVILGKNADVLVLECSFPDEFKVEGHLTPSLAGRIGHEADAKRLVLTHLYPICDSYDIVAQARKIYNGELIIAEDLMKLEV